MKLSEVTITDGKLCAQLVNLLKAGRWELSGADTVAYTETFKWAQGLAFSIASELKEKPKNAEAVIIPEDNGLAPGEFRVKKLVNPPESKKSKKK